MGQNTKIQWADHTLNPFRGCDEVSAGCANCYAREQAKRFPAVNGVWGDATEGGTRVVASEQIWRAPLMWDRQAWWCDACQARQFGQTCPACERPCRRPRGAERPRVFCASIADVFDDFPGVVLNAKGEKLRRTSDGNWIANGGILRNDFPLLLNDVRARLWDLIEKTPNLDWMLLTKRPENVLKMVPDKWRPNTRNAHTGFGYYMGQFPRNVWIGTSVENEATASRIEVLCDIPAAIKFVSCEPLLEYVDLFDSGRGMKPCKCVENDVPNSRCRDCDGSGVGDESFLDLVILGGESGRRSRSCEVDWIRRMVADCRAAKSVSVFVKQLGSRPVVEEPEIGGNVEDTSRKLRTLRLVGRKGGNSKEWPEDLRIRELPSLVGGQ